MLLLHRVHIFSEYNIIPVGYFTVNSFINLGNIDWDWLQQQNPLKSLNIPKHLSFDEPLTIKINGHKNKGIILKPGRNGNNC
jgi:hypothetical protein